MGSIYRTEDERHLLILAHVCQAADLRNKLNDELDAIVEKRTGISHSKPTFNRFLRPLQQTNAWMAPVK